MSALELHAPGADQISPTTQRVDLFWLGHLGYDAPSWESHGDGVGIPRDLWLGGRWASIGIACVTYVGAEEPTDDGGVVLIAWVCSC